MLNLKIIDTQSSKIIQSSIFNSIFDKSNGNFMRWGSTKDNDPDFSPSPEILDIELSEVISEYQKPDKYHMITNGGCSGKNFCGQFCYKNNGKGDWQRHLNLEGVKKILNRMAVQIQLTIEHSPTSISKVVLQPQDIYGNKLAADIDKDDILEDIGQVIDIKYTYILQQAAFGICSANSHPQLFEIAQEFRSRGIIPNITVNGIGFTEELASKFVDNFSAIAVSVNENNKEWAYHTIQMLCNAGCKQVNIHYVLSNESYDNVFSIIDDIKTNNRLFGLNAIVFLAFKDTRKNTTLYTTIKDLEKLKKLYEYCDKKAIRYGMDSCSGPKYLQSISGYENETKLASYVETCCVTRFSSYINVNGDFFGCSFLEGQPEWKEGISVFNCTNFVNDIWLNPKVKAYRQHVLQCGNTQCPCGFFD